MLNTECSGRIADMNYFHLVEFNLSSNFFFPSTVEIENESFTHSIHNLQFLSKGIDHKFFSSLLFRFQYPGHLHLLNALGFQYDAYWCSCLTAIADT